MAGQRDNGSGAPESAIGEKVYCEVEGECWEEEEACLSYCDPDCPFCEDVQEEEARIQRTLDIYNDKDIPEEEYEVR